jgi:hypothetical protein
MAQFRLLLASLALAAGLIYGCSGSAASHNYVPPVQPPVGTPSPQILVPGP